MSGSKPVFVTDLFMVVELASRWDQREGYADVILENADGERLEFKSVSLEGIELAAKYVGTFSVYPPEISVHD